MLVRTFRLARDFLKKLGLKEKETMVVITAFKLIVTCLLVSLIPAASQTRQRAKQQSRASTSFAQKKQAEIRVGREQIAAQIKVLNQFIYLFGSISKGIETAEQLNRDREQSSAAMSSDRIADNKVRLKGSIRNVRTGLAQLESSFRLNPVLQNYYSNVAGVAGLAQTAEAQAATGSFDQAGRSLIAVTNKLVDALLALCSDE
jgi:hypothetical protein